MKPPHIKELLKAKETQRVLRDIVVGVCSAAVALGGNWIMAGPGNRTAEADYVETLQKRISELEAAVTLQASTNTELRIKLAGLQASIEDEVSFEDLLCQVLDAQPGLNWAKVVRKDADNRPEFTMLCLDAEYRSAFNIQPFQYIGQTDYEMWPKETADIFYFNDLSVWTDRAPITTREDWTLADGTHYVGTLTKFYFSFGEVEFVIGHLPRDAFEVDNR